MSDEKWFALLRAVAFKIWKNIGMLFAWKIWQASKKAPKSLEIVPLRRTQISTFSPLVRNPILSSPWCHSTCFSLTFDWRPMRAVRIVNVFSVVIKTGFLRFSNVGRSTDVRTTGYTEVSAINSFKRFRTSCPCSGVWVTCLETRLCGNYVMQWILREKCRKK